MAMLNNQMVYFPIFFRGYYNGLQLAVSNFGWPHSPILAARKCSLISFGYEENNIIPYPLVNCITFMLKSHMFLFFSHLEMSFVSGTVSVLLYSRVNRVGWMTCCCGNAQSLLAFIIFIYCNQKYMWVDSCYQQNVSECIKTADHPRRTGTLYSENWLGI